MIIARAPYRVPLAGGGTDIDFYYKKNVKDFSDNSNWVYPKVDDEAYKSMKVVCNLK